MEWKSFLKMLNNPSKFLTMLQNYDHLNVNAKLISAIRPTIDSMTIESMKQKSLAATFLLEWLKCFLVNYDTL